MFANLVGLEKCCKMHVSELQKSASIQMRMSPPKIENFQVCNYAKFAIDRTGLSYAPKALTESFRETLLPGSSSSEPADFFWVLSSSSSGSERQGDMMRTWL